MGLHIGETAVEHLLGAFDGERFDRIRRRAALIVAAAGIAFGIFVGEDRALRLQHRLGNNVFRRDQLDLVLLAVELGGDRVGDRAIGAAQGVGEEARRLDVVQVVGGAAAHAGSLAKLGLESFSTRRLWRSPPKLVARKALRQSFAISVPMMRAPIAMTLASLCSRARRAESGSDTSAARAAGWGLVGIGMPMPEPHRATPLSDTPDAVASASL